MIQRGEVMNITMKPVAYVHNAVESRKDESWGKDISKIVLEDEYKGGLEGLQNFSHVIIIYYLDKANYNRNQHLQRRAQNREDMPLVGIFSQRGKDRPNQIGMTTVEIISVTDSSLEVKGLDAIDGTPVLDIKPYYPMYDLKENATIPEWVERLMEHYF